MRNESYEFVGEKDEAVGRLLAGLPRVEAPSDFEMRVRARIASGRSAGPSWLTPLVRVTVPAAFLLVVGAYFGYYALYQNTSTPTPEIVAAPESKPAPPQVGSAEPAPVVVAQDSPQIPEGAKPGTTRQSTTPRREVMHTGIDTAESAIRQARSYTQPGRPNQSIQNLDPTEGGPGISPKDVLETMGITANFTSASWKVDSVRRNSLADKSGVKAGDIIEALNDQPLTEKTVLGRRFAGTSVRVRRDDRSIKLELKP